MSSSLAYRLATFNDGLLAMVDKHPEQLTIFIGKQLDRSCLEQGVALSPDEKKKQITEIAEHIAALIRSGNQQDKQAMNKLPLESLIIANFIGHCRKSRVVEESQ